MRGYSRRAPPGIPDPAHGDTPKTLLLPASHARSPTRASPHWPPPWAGTCRAVYSERDIPDRMRRFGFPSPTPPPPPLARLVRRVEDLPLSCTKRSLIQPHHCRAVLTLLVHHRHHHPQNSFGTWTLSRIYQASQHIGWANGQRSTVDLRPTEPRPLDRPTTPMAEQRSVPRRRQVARPKRWRDEVPGGRNVTPCETLRRSPKLLRVRRVRVGASKTEGPTRMTMMKHHGERSILERVYTWRTK